MCYINYEVNSNHEITTQKRKHNLFSLPPVFESGVVSNDLICSQKVRFHTMELKEGNLVCKCECEIRRNIALEYIKEYLGKVFYKNQLDTTF